MTSCDLMLLNVTIKGYTIYSDKKEIEALRQCRGLFSIYKHQRMIRFLLGVIFIGDHFVKYRLLGLLQSAAAYGALLERYLKILKRGR